MGRYKKKLSNLKEKNTNYFNGLNKKDKNEEDKVWFNRGQKVFQSLSSYINSVTTTACNQVIISVHVFHPLIKETQRKGIKHRP